VELTYLGLSCLRLRGREVEVVVDPLPERTARPPRTQPDILVYTSGAADPESLRARAGQPQVVRGPGEYELRGVRITGIAAQASQTTRARLADAGNGGAPAAEALTIMRVEVDDVSVVALGRLCAALTEDQLERLGHVDVLAVPVGGGDALGASEATRLVNAVEPAVVVPVRYHVAGLPGEYEPVERFAKEMGLAEGWRAQPRLSLTGSASSNEDTAVVVLEPRAAT